MKYGQFMMPSHPPERAMYDAIQQDLKEIEWLDQLGYHEVWIGEHLTAPWEPLPAGDLLIAQALARTKRIKVCSGGYIPSFYHPAALALRVCQLDHMAQGRYICGIAAGSQPPDWALTGLDGFSGENRDAAYEAVEIMIKLWTEHVGKTWRFEGEHWTLENVGPVGAFRSHVEPFQKPHPPLAIAGLSPGSSSLAYAGEKGFIPLSVFFNAEVLKSHWTVYSEAAASAGLTPDRTQWRVNREIFVAESDKEAREYVLNSNQVRVWQENHFPLLREYDWIGNLKHDPSVADADVDIDYLMEHLWIVGSPDTVAERINQLSEEVGGFGYLLGTHFDWGTDADPFAYEDEFRLNLELFAREVVPQIEASEPIATTAGD
jgi:alkanesulfonate monooxygenase SsuD/methylene tetrahydromethanopterin reductase-like flavin-dependent oxidoreductase (luciferase family)